MNRYRVERLPAEDGGAETLAVIERFLNDHAAEHPEERIVSFIPWIHGGTITDYIVVLETVEE